MPNTDPRSDPVRRRLVAGALAGATLTGCARQQQELPRSEPSTATDDSSRPAPTKASTTAAAEPIPVEDIPVGGGTVYPEQQVVVTQPSAGDFKAFSAICTHAGCLVGTVTDVITCACHGSEFSSFDGSVVTGPATIPLGPRPMRKDGDSLVVG